MTHISSNTYTLKRKILLFKHIFQKILGPDKNQCKKMITGLAIQKSYDKTPISKGSGFIQTLKLSPQVLPPNQPFTKNLQKLAVFYSAPHEKPSITSIISK